jgi:hypothetical protein
MASTNLMPAAARVRRASARPRAVVEADRPVHGAEIHEHL